MITNCKNCNVEINKDHSKFGKRSYYCVPCRQQIGRQRMRAYIFKKKTGVVLDHERMPEQPINETDNDKKNNDLPS